MIATLAKLEDDQLAELADRHQKYARSARYHQHTPGTPCATCDQILGEHTFEPLLLRPVSEVRSYLQAYPAVVAAEEPGEGPEDESSEDIEELVEGGFIPPLVTYRLKSSWNIATIVGATTSEPPGQQLMDVLSLLTPLSASAFPASLPLVLGASVGARPILVPQGSDQDIALSGFTYLVTKVSK